MAKELIPGDQIKSKAQVIDTHCVYTSSDLTGAIQSTNLVATGLTVEAKIQDLAPFNSAPKSNNLVLRRDNFVVPFIGDYEDATMVSRWGNVTAHCLLLGSHGNIAYLLVLAQVAATRKYRRIGVVFTNTAKRLDVGRGFDGREKTHFIMDSFLKTRVEREFVII